MDVVVIVHEDYTVLTPKQLGGVSLQLLTACLPSTLYGILIPTKCKITESTA